MMTSAMTIPGTIDLRRIGVIGAGQMGRGIAHVCALAGLDVVITDVNRRGARPRARRPSTRNLARQVARGRIREEDKEAALGRIGTAPDLRRRSAIATW